LVGVGVGAAVHVSEPSVVVCGIATIDGSVSFEIEKVRFMAPALWHV
jgi:hypothetical protein